MHAWSTFYAREGATGRIDEARVVGALHAHQPRMRNVLLLLSALSVERVVVAPQLEADVRPVRREVCAPVALGVLPQHVGVGGHVVRFTEWTMDEEGGAIIGFAAELPDGVRAELRVGDLTLSTAQARWFHPALRRLDAMTVCGAQLEPVLALAR